MSKFRDLGINTIPNTMRPPEIGDGGGHGGPNEPGTGTSCPSGPTCTEPDDDEDGPGTSCPSGSTCLGGDDDEHKHSPKPPKHRAGAFTPEAVAQLRQELADRIGS